MNINYWAASRTGPACHASRLYQTAGQCSVMPDNWYNADWARWFRIRSAFLRQLPYASVESSSAVIFLPCSALLTMYNDALSPWRGPVTLRNSRTGASGLHWYLHWYTRVVSLRLLTGSPARPATPARCRTAGRQPGNIQFTLISNLIARRAPAPLLLANTTNTASS